MPNHQTAADYVIPSDTIMSQPNLPYGRPVIGSNLMNGAVKRFVFDFSRWGPILIDRDSDDPKKMLEYAKRVKNAFVDGESIMEFPEAKRNRHPENGLEEFKDPFFRLALGARQAIDRPIKTVVMALSYEKYPEQKYWDKIDGSGKKDWRYFAWDTFAFLKWKYFNWSRGTVRVNFSEPHDIAELAGSGSRKEQGQNVAAETRSIMEKLLEEIKNPAKESSIRVA